jgi:tRNA(Ile2) C34 agmatinyltransferase TiaS
MIRVCVKCGGTSMDTTGRTCLRCGQIQPSQMDDEWDRQIERDVATGRLDKAIAEAIQPRQDRLSNPKATADR